MKIESGFTMFDAIVLAGERRGENPLLARFDVPIKALIPVGGKPMVQRVVEGLWGSGCIERILLCGPEKYIFQTMEEGATAIRSDSIQWVRNEPSPSQSALKALRLAGGQAPILLTTADHALLRPEIVRFFCEKADEAGYDLSVGLASMDLLKRSYPNAKRTSYRFRDGVFCSCNLFGFMNKRAFRAAEFWQMVEERRKKPLQVVGGFGWYWLLRYLTGTLSLRKALDRASKVFGCSVGAVLMPFPEAAIDVDTEEDWRLVETIATRTADGRDA